MRVPKVFGRKLAFQSWVSARDRHRDLSLKEAGLQRGHVSEADFHRLVDPAKMAGKRAFQFEAHASRSASARIDRPDIDERVAAHAMVSVVKIDCRVAMRWKKLDQIANGQSPA
jgi:hypothetical protein